MSDCDKSKEQLIEELASLHREVAELRTTKTAFNTLHELLIALVTTVRTATGTLMLKAVLQEILKISSRLTNAGESSLFLLDTNGIVTESLLARGAVIRELKQNIIGMVLDKGLAGWVIRHRKAGLVTDTMHDDRWLTLPHQPYTVRSALSVPLLRGKVLLGLITLMHSQPRHFSPESAHLMQMSADQIALIIENALLYVERQPLQLELEKILPQVDKQLQPVEEPSYSIDKLSWLGIYIIIADGKFMYTNPGVAVIFGYTFIEFITIESIFELIVSNNRKFVAEQIAQCFQARNQSQSFSCLFKGQRKDGSLIDVQAYGTRTKFNGKPVIIGIFSST